MNGWVFPTTADVGIRCFAETPEKLFECAIHTMSDLLISDSGSKSVSYLEQHASTLTLTEPATESMFEALLVTVLEEVLFRLEVESEWIVTSSTSMKSDSEQCQLQISYEWVDGERVEREIEIKAVTRHHLTFTQLAADEGPAMNRVDVPQITGPGWYCDVIFDI